MSDLVNPYIAGAPVTETKMFFGRDDIFEWIERSLAGQYTDHVLVVHGQRRVGKTSVLKQLGYRLPQRYIPVFFDLQGRTHTSLDRFLWWLAREIVRVLKQERNIVVPAPDKESFAKDPDFLEEQFLPSLQEHLGDSILLLTIDEFDTLEEPDVRETLARPLIDYLRRLMGRPGLTFIFSIGASGRKLENMQSSYTEFFKSALYKKISFLEHSQTRRLITNPVQDLLEYEPSAVERIYRIASGHPYFTQLICHELFARCQQTGQRTISQADVEAVLDDVVERGTVNLKFMWDEATDLEKWVLANLARLSQNDQHALAEALRRQRVRFNDKELNSALLRMREKDILAIDNRFVIYLLKLWLEKNRPLERVQEELVEVNPIANRFIEIAQTYKDQGLADKAMESFQQALQVDAVNIQAQVGIASVWLDQKNYERAVAEFDKALTIDDEDVAARAGLCDAYLALGDQSLARNRTREAIQAYQKVLDINAEHTDARQRMAEIYRQRAEKALTDGKDEETITAFGDALKFTPEDQKLVARYAQVRKERQARFLAALLARAEKELATKNYDRAIAALEDARDLAPEDTTIESRIAAIKEEQRTAWLTAVCVQVDKDLIKKNYSYAIATLENAINLAMEDTTLLARISVLEEALKISPIGTTSKERLANISKQRELQIADLKTRTQETATIEQALDRERNYGEAQSAIAKKFYDEAQSAIAKKDYDKAIRLLKEIVVQETDYKDASHLLAQTIELRRKMKPFWQNNWFNRNTALTKFREAIKSDDDERIVFDYGSILDDYDKVTLDERKRYDLAKKRFAALMKVMELLSAGNEEQLAIEYDPILDNYSKLAFADQQKIIWAKQCLEMREKVRKAVALDEDEQIVAAYDPKLVRPWTKFTPDEQKRIDLAVKRSDAWRAFQTALKIDDDDKIVFAYESVLDGYGKITSDERERHDFAKKRIMTLLQVRKALAANDELQMNAVYDPILDGYPKLLQTEREAIELSRRCVEMRNRIRQAIADDHDDDIIRVYDGELLRPWMNFSPSEQERINMAFKRAGMLEPFRIMVQFSAPAIYLNLRCREQSVNVGDRVRLSVDISAQFIGLGAIILPNIGNRILIQLSAPGLLLRNENLVEIILSDTSQDIHKEMECLALRPGDWQITATVLEPQPESGKAVSIDINVKGTRAVEIPSLMVSPSVRRGHQPDLVTRVYVTSDQSNYLTFNYIAYSPISRMNLPGTPMGSVKISRSQLALMTAQLAEIVSMMPNTYPANVHSRLATLGKWLYQTFLPKGMQSLYKQVQLHNIRSWQFFCEAEPWIPWELLTPSSNTEEIEFIGEQFAIARTIEGLGTPIQYEFPLGHVGLMLDQRLRPSHNPREWEELFASFSKPRLALPLMRDYGGSYISTLEYDSPVWGLHFEGVPDSFTTDVKALAQPVYDANLSEEIVRQSTFNLWSKRPLVTFGMVKKDSLCALTKMESQWVPTFIKAGVGGFVGTLWTTDLQIDRLFWSVFYNGIWERKTLGESVLQARDVVRQTFPNSFDWLAYFVVGDTMARGYFPNLSGGYTWLECLSHNLEHPLRIGERCKFLAQMSNLPPTSYHGRRHQLENRTFNKPRLCVFAPEFDVEPNDWMTLDVSTNYFEKIFSLRPLTPGKRDLFFKFFDGEELLQTIDLTIEITGE